MATGGLGILEKSESPSSLKDESESGKSLGVSLFSTEVRLALELLLAVGGTPLEVGGVTFGGTLVRMDEEEEVLDVFFDWAGDGFPEGILGGRTMTSLSESSDDSDVSFWARDGTV